MSVIVNRDPGLLRLVRRRWRTMTLAFLLVAGGGGVATLLLPPSYEASAKLLVMRTEQRLGGMRVVQDAIPELTGASHPLYTQVELLRSRPLFDEVIKAVPLLEPDGTPWSTEKLDRKLRIAPLPKTDVIELSFRASDPALAKRVVEAVSAAYMRSTERYRRDGVKEGLKYVDEQLEGAHARLRGAEDALLAFKRRSGSIALSSEIESGVAQLGQLNHDIRSRQVEMASVEARAASLRAKLGMTSGQGLRAVAMTQNPRLQSLRAQLAEAETSPLLSKHLGERHPEMIELSARIAMIKQAIRAETQGSAPVALDEVRSTLVQELVEAEATAASLRSSVAAAEGRRAGMVAASKRLPAQELELARLTREVQVSSGIYQGLLQKWEEARLSLAIAPTYAQVIEPAKLPERPLSPLKGPAAPVLVLAGCAAAFGAGALRDLLDRTPEPQALVATFSEIPLFVTLPLLGWQARQAENWLSNPAYREAMRTLGVAVESLPGAPGARVLAMSSSLPHEGKSVTTVGLARCLMEAGHRVLVIDGDFRRPRLHALLGQGPRAGFGDVLAGRLTPGQACSSVGGITLVQAGRSGVPSLAQIKEGLESALATWRQSYDFILLDLPPLALMAEVVHFGRACDGLLFLANLQKTPTEMLVAGVRQLQAMSVPLAGVVALSPTASPQGGYYFVAPATRELKA